MKPHRYGLSRVHFGLSRVHFGLWVIWRDGVVLGTCLNAQDAFALLVMLRWKEREGEVIE